MKRVIYDNKPSAIEAVGNGSYLYRWQIEQIVSEEFTHWSCYQVIISNTPTQESITEKVIEAIWGGGVEQKLINDYQASLLGVIDQSYTEPYMEFLAERKALKETIAEDVERWKSAL
ncbi:MAG: hypothetical protein SNF93_07765 [Rikenellaceae bacterium]